jgi:hypothetical protein
MIVNQAPGKRPHSLKLMISPKNCFRIMMFLWGYGILKLLLAFSIMRAYGINPYIFFLMDVATVPLYVLGMARLIGSLTEKTRRPEVTFLWAVITALASVAPYVYAAWAGNRAIPLHWWVILLIIMVFPLVDLTRRLCRSKNPALSEQRLSG